MFSRLVSRVLPRAYASNVASLAGMRYAMLVRQQLLTRTFLTTAYVADPATKSKSTTAAAKTRKPAAKKAAPKKKAAKKKAAPKKKATKKPKKAAKAKTPIDPNDLDARFKTPLKSVKLFASEHPPSRPPNAYGLFIKQHWLDMGPLGRDGFQKRSAELAAQWKQMSDAEKQVYVQKTAEAREASNQARLEWYKNTDPRIIRAYNIQRRAKNKKPFCTPLELRPKTPMNAYMVFAEEKFHSVTVDNDVAHVSQARMKKVAELWRALSPEEKESYKAKGARS